MREVLKLRVLEGQDAVNDLVRRISVPPVIEVRDENDRPLEGADVVFRLPVTGPGGIFPGQQMVQKSRTNVQGQATVVGYQANGVPGQFTIAVTATRNDQMGQITVRQTNGQELGLYPPKKKSRKWLWIGIAAAAGGAVAGILVARGGGSSSTAATTPTITITPGPITIGGH
jgi:hypothetical protein